MSILGHCSRRRLTRNARGQRSREGWLIRSGRDVKPELHGAFFVPVRDDCFDQLRVVVRVDLDDPKIVLVRFGGNLLGVVGFGVLDENHIFPGILEPADEHEFIENAGLGLLGRRCDQCKRISFPEVAVPSGVEPDRNLIIGRRKIEGWHHGQPCQADADEPEGTVVEADCLLGSAHLATNLQPAISGNDGIMPRVHTSGQSLTRG